MSDSVSEHRPPATADSAATFRRRRIVCEYTRDSDSFFPRGPGVPTARVLDGVSLSVSTGEFVAIAGPSRSDKSMPLRLFATLDTPTRGGIWITGIDVWSLLNHGRTKLCHDIIGIVFRHFHPLPSLSVRGNVMLSLIEHGVSKRGRRACAEDLLKQVGFSGHADHRPGKLPGGEQ